jgi:hypothetical protein
MMNVSETPALDFVMDVLEEVLDVSLCHFFKNFEEEILEN